MYKELLYAGGYIYKTEGYTFESIDEGFIKMTTDRGSGLQTKPSCVGIDGSM
jgi:hypothetical protein